MRAHAKQLPWEVVPRSFAQTLSPTVSINRECIILSIGTKACPGLRSGMDASHRARESRLPRRASSFRQMPESCSAGACPPLGSGCGVAESTVPIRCTNPQLPLLIPWWAGGNRHERLVRKHVPLSDQGWPDPATPARISCRGDSRIAPGGVVMPNRPELNRQQKDLNRPLLLGEGWGEGETTSARARGTNDPRTLPPTNTPTLHTLVCRHQPARAIAMKACPDSDPGWIPTPAGDTDRHPRSNDSRESNTRDVALGPVPSQGHARQSRIAEAGEMPNRPEQNRQQKDPNRPLLLGEGWGEGETTSARARGANDPRTLPPTNTPTLHTLVCRRQPERATTMRIDAPKVALAEKCSAGACPPPRARR